MKFLITVLITSFACHCSYAEEKAVRKPAQDDLTALRLENDLERVAISCDRAVITRLNMLRDLYEKAEYESAYALGNALTILFKTREGVESRIEIQPGAGCALVKQKKTKR